MTSNKIIVTLKPRAQLVTQSRSSESSLSRQNAGRFAIQYHSTCTRANCKMVYQIHDHCRGKTSKGKLCENRPLLDQYCHIHKDQARCFYPGCHESAWYARAHCYPHSNHYKVYQALVDALLYRGSYLEKKLDLGILQSIIEYM